MMRPANEAVYWLTGSFGERQPRVPTAGDFSNRELTVSRPKIFVFVSLVFIPTQSDCGARGEQLRRAV